MISGLSDNGINTIQVRLGLVAEEELASARVLAGMGHREAAGLMLTTDAYDC